MEIKYIQNALSLNIQFLLLAAAAAAIFASLVQVTCHIEFSLRFMHIVINTKFHQRKYDKKKTQKAKITNVYCYFRRLSSYFMLYF
jgi:hypothetical protein